jgi:hypothetical protein
MKSRVAARISLLDWAAYLLGPGFAVRKISLVKSGLVFGSRRDSLLVRETLSILLLVSYHFVLCLWICLGPCFLFSF